MPLYLVVSDDSKHGVSDCSFFRIICWSGTSPRVDAAASAQTLGMERLRTAQKCNGLGNSNDGKRVAPERDLHNVMRVNESDVEWAKIQGNW